jgi:hypothetical protein
MARETDSCNGLQVRGDRVVMGEWSGDLEELTGKGFQLRRLLGDRQYAPARDLVQAQALEVQAALVAMDENPEEVLALTGMDQAGRPGYSPAVIARLPADVLADLIAPRQARWERFNLEVLRQMPAETFARAVAETLEPVDYQDFRDRVTWEWLEAVAALDDSDRIAELLYQVDRSFLEEALTPRVECLDLNVLVPGGEDGIYAYNLLSASGEGWTLPPIVETADPEAAEVIGRLHQAAPELIAEVMRNAWERGGGDEG